MKYKLELPLPPSIKIDDGTGIKKRKAFRTRQIEKGLVFAKKEKEQSMFSEEREFKTILKVKFPWSSSLLKNRYRGYAWHKGGMHVYIKKQSRDMIENLILYVRAEMKRQKVKFFKNRVSFALDVEKPKQKIDAINLIDCVADMLKVAIGVDDSWYEVHAITWNIIKVDPHVTLYVCQKKDSCFDAFSCTYCGRIRPITELTERFQKIFAETGITKGRVVCNDCRIRTPKNGV
jgi:hypothetical protein